jgi:hypothetical protein
MVDLPDPDTPMTIRTVGADDKAPVVGWVCMGVNSFPLQRGR